MKDGWQIKALKEFCSDYKSAIVDGPFGSNLKREHFEDQGVPVLKIQNIKSHQIKLKNLSYITEEKAEELKRHSYQKNDIIMTKLGDPLGVSAIVEESECGVIIADLVRIRADKIDTKFLCYQLNAPAIKEFINNKQKGATRPRVKISIVRDLPIAAPTLSEQKRIVAILDEAFAGIDQAIANTQQNLANARELFESYLNTIFTQKGEKWMDRQLSSLCKKITVGHVGSMANKYKESGIPFLRSQNIRPFEVCLENVVFIDEIFDASLKKSRLLPGDLAIVRTGYPGTAAVIPPDLTHANCSDLVIVRPGEDIDAEFLSAFFNSVFGKELVLGKIVGAAQKHFNVTAAKNVMLHVPPISEQKEIVLRATLLRTESQKLENVYRQKINSLNKLKQSLLQKAFSGELTADDLSIKKEAFA